MRKEIEYCKCGTPMSKGSGCFTTDYRCNECEAEYNSEMYKLVPRLHWGEETGEQF